MNGRKSESQLEFRKDSHCILIDEFRRQDGKTVRFWFTRWKFKYTGIQCTRTCTHCMRVNLNIMQFFFAVCVRVFCIHFPVLFPFNSLCYLLNMHSLCIRETQWIAVAHCFHPFWNLCSRSLFEQKKLWTNPMSHTSSWKDNDWTETKQNKRTAKSDIKYIKVHFFFMAVVKKEERDEF